MFIIYNTFAIAVTQRRSEIGILRALGATRGQIRWLFLGESAVTGLVGSLGGLAFGVLIARGDRGVDRRADRRRLRRRAARRRGVDRARRCCCVALAIGIVTSIVAAAIPARSAARVDPVQALQKGKYQVLSAGESRLRAMLRRWRSARVSIVCLRHRRVASGLLRRLRPGDRRRAAAQPAAVARARASAAAAPEVAAAGRRRAGGGQPDPVAAPDVGERRRADAVAGAGRSRFAGMARASYDSIIDWMETALNPELFVMPSQSIVVRTIRFPASMGPEVAAIPGVRARADGARRAHHVPRHAGHGGRGRDREHRARPRSAPPVAGQRRRDVPATARRARADRRPTIWRSCSISSSATCSRSRRPTASSGCRSSASSSTTPISRARS